MTRLSPRAARHLVTATVLLATTALAGCAGTMVVNYPASNGVQLRLGHLEGNNLLVLTAAEGDPGTLLGALTNTGDRPMTVRIGLPDSPTSVSVPAHDTTLLGPTHEPVDLASVPAAPGAMVELSVASDVAGGASLQVPVLDGTLPAYAGLVPQP